MADRISLIPEEQILKILHYLKINITPEELRKPDANVLIEIFNAFLSEFDFELDCLDTPPLHAYQCIPYPDIYEDGLQLATFMTAAGNLMHACGFPDLSIKDILEPKPKRTRRILSYIIHLWKYASNTHKISEDIGDEHLIYAEEWNQLLKRIDELKLKLNNNNATYEQGQSEYIEDCEINEQLVSLFSENQKVQEEMRMKYQTFKNLIAEETKDLNDIKVQNATLREKIFELEQQIITSPDRFKAELEQLQQERKQIIETENGLTVKCETLKEQLKAQNNSLEHIGITKDFVMAINEDGNKIHMNCISKLAEQINIFESNEEESSMCHKQYYAKAEKIQILDSKAMQENLCFQKRNNGLKEVTSKLLKEIEMDEENRIKFKLRELEMKREEFMLKLQDLDDDHLAFYEKLESTLDYILKRCLKTDEEFIMDYDKVINTLSME